MNKNRSILILLIAISSLLVSSCKKKASPPPSSQNSNSSGPFTGCRIAQIIEGNTLYQGTYTFYYNNDGTVSRIFIQPDTNANDSYNKYMVYNKSYMFVNTVFHGESNPDNTDSLALDNQNRVTVIYHNSIQDEGSFSNQVWDSYQYDTLGDMVETSSKNFSDNSSANYQWKNGDIVWNAAENDYDTYIYDSSLYNTGNITANLLQFEQYGRGIYVSRHLHTQQIIDNSDTVFYNYSLDAMGKITSETVSQDGLIYTTQITYSCE